MPKSQFTQINRALEKMKRLISNIITKMMTGKSVDDYVKENLLNFCIANKISNIKTNEFRIDKDPIDPRWGNITFVGTCARDGKRYGVIVTIDENTGYTHGSLFVPQDGVKVEVAVSEYKRGSTIYRSFQSYFLNEVCEGKHEILKDSTEYRR